MRVIILINQNLNKTLYKNWELEYKKKKLILSFGVCSL